MKKLPLVILTASLSQANAAVVATEEHNLNTWQDEITSGVNTSATFSETFAGAWGTFDIEISVSSFTANTTTAAAMNLTGATTDLEHDNRDFSYSVSIANESLNAGYSVQNLTFTSIKFEAASNNADSGTFTGPWGTQTWTDGNSPQGITGHDTSTVRFDLNALNGGNPFTAYTSEFEGGVYRISDLRATADVDLVPEPSSTALLGLGSLALLARRRR